jgi:very-short-patch-repair endonuclease
MLSVSELEAILHEHGARQHGLVTRSQLLRAGVPDHMIDRSIRSGRLRTVFRGVYRMVPVLSDYAVGLAAVLACGSDSRLSHRSAGDLWDLLARQATEQVREVTVHRCRRLSIDGIRLHRVKDFDPNESTVRHGIPVTTPARTLLDMGGCAAGPRELEQALARAERDGLVTRESLRTMVDRHPRHRGARHLRHLLWDDEPAAFTRSAAEEALLSLIRLADLPAPKVNTRLQRYEVDFLWPAQRVIVEVDGLAFHSSARALVADRRRDADLVAAGYRVVRFTWHDLTQQRERTLVNLTRALMHG